MPNLNTAISISPLSDRSVGALRKRRFPRDVIDSLNEFQRRSRKGYANDKGLTATPDEIFLVQSDLGASLDQHLRADGHSIFLSRVMRHIETRQALVQKIYPSEDFTFFIDRTYRVKSAGSEAKADQIIAQLLGLKTSTSREGELWLWDDHDGRAASGRALVSSCSRGAKWSVTFRRQQEYPARHSTEEFFNEFGDITSLLSSIIFPNDSDEHGLVVITGRTGSGKSQIARKLIQSYLKTHSVGRIPHLVTFEEPIEKFFQKIDVADSDCTQRERHRDAKSLNEVLMGALRQTPKAVFVGETRHGRDWKKLLEFAGTGHLVITTAHAGSLVEAMSNILKETESNTPATRSIVADRLLAVVHVKNATEVMNNDETDINIPFLVPAIWHRTPLGIKALMAEGLSSLLPNTPPERRAMKGRRVETSQGFGW